ncbi:MULTISPECIES: hypothetical protein [Kingella]|uniref:Uncharacterized protein n=1 Tax=Kingella bonacorsii TaxID=2796361 RepID=A0ABS1BUD8_9NEIS|nr:hypothetical protein [Kingella bonacorsii]MBK0396885.1 hypothetical protein [Kingella bonacorsii]
MAKCRRAADAPCVWNTIEIRQPENVCDFVFRLPLGWWEAGLLPSFAGV